MTQSTDLPEGWIAHDGGECPVPPNSRPDMIFAIPGTKAKPAYHWKTSAQDAGRKWRASHADWSQFIAYKPEQPQ